MNIAYDRSYQLIIAKPPEYSKPGQEFKNSPLDGGSTKLGIDENDDFLTYEATKGLLFTDVEMTAKIKLDNASGGSKSNAGSIVLRGLSPESKEFIASVNNLVVLKAGYKSDPELPVIFTGQVSKALSDKTQTTLELKEGWSPANTIRLTKEYLPGTKYSDIFKDLTNIFKENGIGIGELVLNENGIAAPVPIDSPANTVAENGWRFNGYLRKALEVLCDEFYYQWDIVNSKLFIYPKGYPKLIGRVSLDASRIVSIESLHEGETSTSTNPETPGVKVRTLCDGRIDTTKQLQVTDGRYKGLYRIREVNFNLDYSGQDWYADIEADGIREGK